MTIESSATNPGDRLEARIKQEVANLGGEFEGTFGEETVGRYAEDVATTFKKAKIPDFVPLFVYRTTRDRLRDAAGGSSTARKNGPVSLLFICGKNAGRSQMAAAFARAMASENVHVQSAGLTPAPAVHAEVASAMAEIDIDISQEIPTQLTDDMVEQADVIVTMGCGDRCAVMHGKRYFDWNLRDPEGQDNEAVRAIRDDIKDRVGALISGLVIPPQYSAASAG